MVELYFRLFVCTFYLMVRCGQLVVGPAGSGKSTYCNAIKELCADQHRRAYLINLDPAAEDLPYECDIGNRWVQFGK